MITETDLRQYIGTDQYYKHWTGALVYTDGVQYLGANGAYWLIDAIASYRRKEPFQVWTLTVDQDGDGAVLTMVEDTDQPELVRQEILYTDFPLPEIKLYLIDGVLLLTSEY